MARHYSQKQAVAIVRRHKINITPAELKRLPDWEFNELVQYLVEFESQGRWNISDDKYTPSVIERLGFYGKDLFG